MVDLQRERSRAMLEASRILHGGFSSMADFPEAELQATNRVDRLRIVECPPVTGGNYDISRFAWRISSRGQEAVVRLGFNMVLCKLLFYLYPPKFAFHWLCFISMGETIIDIIHYDKQYKRQYVYRYITCAIQCLPTRPKGDCRRGDLIEQWEMYHTSVPVSPTSIERCLTCLYQYLKQAVRGVSHICTSLSYKQWEMSHTSVPVSPTSNERYLTSLYQSLLQAVGDVSHVCTSLSYQQWEMSHTSVPVSPTSGERCLTRLYQSLLQAVRDVSHV